MSKPSADSPPSSDSVAPPGAEVPGGDAKRTIQADRPIERISEDEFDRAPFASQIAQIVATRVDPTSLVIGLYGPWGDGKTSTLAMIKEGLERGVDIITMDYNPWFYGNSTEALTKSFFASIRSKLEKSGFFSRENIGELMAGFGGALPQVGSAVQKLGEAMTTEELTETRDKLGEILRKHRKKVVIFIDDIDRLDRREIQTLFKLVRLSGGFDRTTYVLAFDDEVVAEALGEAYGAGDPIAGRRFLEKIVQVPLHLPPAKPEKLREIMFAACDRCLGENDIKLLDGEGSELGGGLANAFAYALKTPRQVKLFENAVSFALPLLKDEVRAIDQIQIEALRVFYPGVYDALRKNPEAVLQSRKENPERRPSVVELAIDAIKGPEEERSAVRRFLRELFPRFGNTGYGTDWEASWAGEKRVCSRDYFHRYFTYAVPAGDISDLIINDLIERATAEDAPAVASMFEEAYQRGAAELLIRKLRSREDGVALEALPTLVAEIAASSASIPISRELFLSDFVVEQAVILVVKLAARSGLPKQDQLLTLAVENASSLLFAAHLIRHCGRDMKPSDELALNRDRVFPLTAILVRRVREIAQSQDFITAIGSPIGRIIYTVRATGSDESVNDLNDLLQGFLAAANANAVRLIRAFAGRSQSGDGITRVSDITYSNYSSIALSLDPEQLYASLRAQFGDEIAAVDWDDAGGTIGDEDRRIANQFAYLHLHPEDPEPTAAE